MDDLSDLNGEDYIAYDINLIADYENRHGKIEQLRKYKTIGRLYLLPVLGPVAVGDISIEMYQRCISNATPRPRKGKNGEYYLTAQLSKKYLKTI